MMNTRNFALTLLCAAAAVGVGVAKAQTAPLQPQAQRIADAAIQTDMQTYEDTQRRIKALNEKGRPVRDYHLAKAQCWLDVSFHEYTRNDRSAFPLEALRESEKLIVGMETGQNPLPMDTPLVNGADRLREDLWAQSGALKRHAGFACAAAKTGCAEVELVHAGNEHKQQQWRHAKPYVQIAEDLMVEAERLAGACQPPAPVKAAVVPVALVPAPTPTPTPVPVPQAPPTTPVLFNYDKFEAREIRPQSMADINALTQRLQAEPGLVKGITLVGHADRLNRAGHPHYNVELAEKRVQTVRKLLTERGVPPAIIRTDSRGDKEQIKGCEMPCLSVAAMRECLLPNRRVEIILGVMPH